MAPCSNIQLSTSTHEVQAVRVSIVHGFRASVHQTIHANSLGLLQTGRMVYAYILALGAVQILQLVGTLLLLHHGHKG